MRKRIVLLSLTVMLTAFLSACGTKADTFYENGRNFLYGTDEEAVDLEKAYTNLEAAKEAGKTEASFYLGLLCDRYLYPQQDYEQAKIYYEACGDYPYAQIALGFLYKDGQGVTADPERAKELFQAAIDQECTEGRLGLGYIALEEGDYQEAFEHFSKASEGTEPIYTADAMHNIGNLYCYGLGIRQNFSNAMEWYLKSADLNNPKSMDSIAYLYQAGLGVRQDPSQAMEWYLKAADLNDSDAMTNIGYLYQIGLGVPQDSAQAMKWYLKAVDLNNSRAMYMIAYAYGEDQDFSQAMEWYLKAADFNDSDAMANIGYFYQEGLGVEQDFSQAMEWYLKAVDFNHSIAMYNIGYLYEEGLGVEQDYAKAIEWYEKAAEFGMAQAQENAEYLKSLLQ